MAVNLAHLSDIVRLYAVHKRNGGVYLDNDAFVLNPQFGAFRRCPFVLSSGQVRQHAHCSTRGGPLPVSRAEP